MSQMIPMGAPPMSAPPLPPMGPEAMGPPPPPDDGGEDPVEILRALVEGTQMYLQVEPDDSDKQVATQVLNLLQKLLAQNQMQAEKALGVGPAQKYMAKAYGQA